MKSAPRLRFAELTYDPGRREVFRGPQRVHLTPKAFSLLELLLAKRPNAISKEEILETLWPAVSVTEGSLAALVKALRKSLGGSGDAPSLIRTVFGFGYAFDEPVVEVADGGEAPNRHVLVWGKQEMALAEGENLIGRGPELPIWVAHRSVSREHARVHVHGEHAEIEDLDSKNGTFRGSQRVTGRTALSNGDEVRIGEVRLVYFGPSADLSGETATAR